MLLETNIHRVRIEGGFVFKMKPAVVAIHKKHQKSFCTSYTEYDYYRVGIEQKYWKQVVDGLSEEELEVILPQYASFDYIVQDEEFLSLVLNHIPYTLLESSTVTVDVQSNTDKAEDYLNKTMTMMGKYQSQLERMAENTFNTLCNTHSGGIPLSEYNQTMLCEDICTDLLQNYLKEGWRILSVNVQPDQRRPDYILGKVVPDRDVTPAALRG
jgi:hypothetical protein